MRCRSCGDVVDPRRVELGYDYCLRERCQQRCLRPVTLAAVGINKAGDYYTTAEELLPPRLPASTSAGPEEESAAKHRTLPHAAAGGRPETTIDRLVRLEAGLDRELAECCERFELGEITAREMDRECDDLIATYNKRIMSENIRYRSMLRRTRART